MNINEIINFNFKAAFSGQKDVFEYLIANGADINDKNNEGETALLDGRSKYY